MAGCGPLLFVGGVVALGFGLGGLVGGGVAAIAMALLLFWAETY